MMPRRVPGGIVPRWYCYNPHCRYPFHETRWCPEQMSAGSAEVTAAPPLPSPDHEPTLWELREERLRRVAAEAERARPAQPAARPDPGFRWLVVIVIGLLLVVVMLGVLGSR
ncbi:hypothetical protein REK76_29325 (plasmid) [Nocardia farcinica]|uniref:hypothetical protein n=1 Tax=Nocardia farcinica TaxID=37329 RepID=UPI001893CEC9|nr:hypothetical protein [Nocardia farcinica]MBF6284488.1 hypothetical protein [Nocardia farcinica]